MNRTNASLILIACLFVCAMVVAQTHEDLQQIESPDQEKAAVPDSMKDPAAAPHAADNKILSRSPNTPTSLVGTVLDPDDRAIPRTTITLTEADGTKHTTISDSFGNFRFRDVSGGQQVILSAEAVEHSFSDLPIAIAGETIVSWRAAG